MVILVPPFVLCAYALAVFHAVGFVPARSEAKVTLGLLVTWDASSKAEFIIEAESFITLHAVIDLGRQTLHTSSSAWGFTFPLC